MRFACPMALALLLAAGQAGASDAMLPSAPSNLSVAAFKDASNGQSNSFAVLFDDNSTDETGFEIQQKPFGAPDEAFTSVGIISGAPGIQAGHGAILFDYDEAAACEFRVRALRGDDASAFTETSGASFAPFAAPTDLRAAAKDGRVQLFWSDHATSEAGYEVQFREGTSGDLRTVATLTTDALPDGTAVDFTRCSRYQIEGGFAGVPPGATVQFQIRAIGAGPPSDFSDIATLTLPATLLPPDGLIAVVLGEHSTRLDWTDANSNESGFIIQARFLPDGEFFDVDTVLNRTEADFDITARSHTLSLPGTFPYPGLPYEVRVLAAYAAQDGNQIISPVSNAVTAEIPFHAPSHFTATVTGESAVDFTWADRSSVESAFRLLARKAGTVPYAVLATTSANATRFAVSNLVPGTSYDFAVQAVYIRAAEAQVESTPSNVVTLSLPFSPPSGLIAAASSDRQINLSWQDHSTAESGSVIYCKKSTESAFQACGVTGPDVTTFSARFVDAGATTPLVPNTTYEFEVRAFATQPALVEGDEVISPPTTGLAVTKDGVTADLSPPMIVGQTFSHTITATQGQSALIGSQITGALPPGITYDPATRILSGTPTLRGAFTPVLILNWANGWTSAHTLHLRPFILPGRPVVGTPIADHQMTVGDGPLSIPLDYAFSDPDSESAVSLHLSGPDGASDDRSITLLLNDSVTPLTTANFRACLNNPADGYAGSVFHRLVPGFVWQGGAYRTGAASGTLSSVAKLAPVPNEPGLPNLAGTLAMAKQPGDPHSTTTDFFFNLADNSSSLDFQHEGYSVFGRVAQPSLATLMELATATADGESSPPIDASKLVRIHSITSSVPVLTSHSATSSSTGVAIASVSGMNLSLSPVAPGASTISLQVSDLDGNQLQAPLTFQVTVNNTLSNWATTEGLTSGQNGPTDDPDLDGSKNLLEYALMSSPGTADGSAEPALNTVTDGADKKATITFKVRKFAALTYTVEGSSNLTTWTPVWTSTSGFAVPAVSASVNNADHTLVTIKDSVPYSDTTPRFLQLKVTAP